MSDAVYDEALDFANELFDLVHITSPVLTAAHWHERSTDPKINEDDKLWCIAMCEAFGGVPRGWDAVMENVYSHYETMLSQYNDPVKVSHVPDNQRSAMCQSAVLSRLDEWTTI